MIAGIFHQGSGLGNQLHRYVGARVMALDKNASFGMFAPNLFKGASFMKLDMGTELYGYEVELSSGKVIPIFPVRPVTIDVVDGEFQGEKYFEHRLDEIREWLKVEPIEMPDNVCVINFRGGEYVHVPDLFLPQEYWNMAINLMRDKYPDITFEVHTDDPETAKEFFPDFKCIHDIELNWRSIRYAKHLILSNSSFAILPALLGDACEIIAPKYWAGYNKGYWQLEENYYKKFNYIHHDE